jgi:hypothetical protein
MVLTSYLDLPLSTSSPTISEYTSQVGLVFIKFMSLLAALAAQAREIPDKLSRTLIKGGAACLQLHAESSSAYLPPDSEGYGWAVLGG